MNLRSLPLSAAVAFIVIGAAATPQSAAAQETYTACRIPEVGAIYMIGLDGLPSECLDEAHVEFSWTEGGAPADGSVTTATLADAAVSAPKLADAAVSASKLAEASVTASALAEGSVTAAALAADAVDSLSILDGSVRGAELRDGTVTTDDISDRTIQAEDVGFNELTALNFAPRATGAIAVQTLPGASALPTTPTDIGSISFSAPAEGTVLLFLVGSAFLGGQDTRIRIGLGTSSGSTDLHEIDVGYVNGAEGADFYAPFTAVAATPVFVGGISTYYATAWRDPLDAAAGMNLTDMRIVLLFVPN